MLSTSHLPQLDVITTPGSTSGYRADYPGSAHSSPGDLGDDIAAAWFIKAQIESCSPTSPSPPAAVRRQACDFSSPILSESSDCLATSPPFAAEVASVVSPTTPPGSSETSTSPATSSPSPLKAVNKKRKRLSSSAEKGECTRPRRNRINYTRHQLQAMEVVFQRTQYPDVMVMEDLSLKQSIPVEKLATWFQNRRSKFRKESKNGHISWMRSQLYSQSAPDCKPTRDDHVLSTPVNTHSMDMYMSNYRPTHKMSTYGQIPAQTGFYDAAPHANRDPATRPFQHPLPFSYPYHQSPYTYTEMTSSTRPYNVTVTSPSTATYSSTTWSDASFSGTSDSSYAKSSYSAVTSTTDSRYYSQCYYQSPSTTANTNATYSHF